ncbi:hypothetical protein TWF106_003918 [Orbilia oligospora]|uniref:Uncharacterized protein n=1 Tax=Orbilia oligospora TaxID=2813651 RepID=A0A7C8QRV7_ORBOL|nr:hypothetical protein TWF106_003918 [Orbilia oligospora]
MSDYPYRAYSPSDSGPNRSPTRRTPNPPGANYPAANDWNRNVHSMPGFEGWRSDDGPNALHASTPNIVPEVVPKDPFLIPQTSSFSQSSNSYGVPPSLQPGSRDSISGSSRSTFTSRQDAEFDLAFGTGPTPKRDSYSTATSSSDSPYRRRHARTPSESSNDSASRSRDRRSGQQNRDRTPSTSPSRAITRDGVATSSSALRTPSGSIMSAIFNSENAAAVGSVLGSAASYLGSRAGVARPGDQPQQEYDNIPGGYNNRPVPDTASGTNNAFGIGDAMNYLSSHLAAPQTPAPPPPAPSQQQGGSPFTLGNALNYLQHATQGQAATAPGNNNGIPQNFQLAGIDIDLKWIAQKASEQNPWVLLGGAVVSFWIISSIIATLIWYGMVAGVLYVIYIVGVKNGGFQAISGGSAPPTRRISTPGNTGSSWGSGGRAPGGGTEWRRRS